MNEVDIPTLIPLAPPPVVASELLTESPPEPAKGSKFDALFQDFPLIYGVQAVEDPFANDGFHCGVGWFELLYGLSQELNEIQLDLPEDDRFRVTEVVTIGGGLKFYVDGADARVAEAIDRVEEASYGICEQCGAPGQRRQRGDVLATSCDRC